ncbi:hypothetical protein [Marinactinospora rubrisoli]|uniref:Uncharacterized protein n=1 Tax=Marinactinospora rubrisoli TaxID=2715399 RepID=A0ABW2KDB7_9ACTN
MMTYDVKVIREDRQWVAIVEGLRGGATATRTLAKLDVEVRDVISCLTDTDPDSFGIVWHWGEAIGSDNTEAMDRFAEMRDRLEAARADYERVQSAVVISLRHAGVSVRDAAWLLGISFQRVQQLDAAGR